MPEDVEADRVLQRLFLLYANAESGRTCYLVTATVRRKYVGLIKKEELLWLSPQNVLFFSR